ncbi:MAG: DUF3343 domain-containing protein [Treponema sp.]|nr:DUF3343 domain-containing protein [Treponema sp.]
MFKRVAKTYLVIAFHTTAEAMATEKICNSFSPTGRLIPLPRSVSAGCGLAWKDVVEHKEQLAQELAKNDIIPEGFYTCTFMEKEDNAS